VNNTMTFLRTAALAAAFLLLPAAAQDKPRGAPFFLLSDATYASDETAMVRLEATDMGAVSEYGGADVYVYRVDQPLGFLERQKNLHRIDVAGDYAGPGLANALARVWDQWWTGSRKAWRSLFSTNARQAVTAQAPETRTHPLAKAPAVESLNPSYRPLKGHTLVDRFRYPVQFARPIAPPAGVKLAGSSSEFIAPSEGNVMIPLGRREPGLYLVEAMVGDHRAVTMVFVSDSAAVTKVSSKQMVVWVADRAQGLPVFGADIVWSDGVGVLGNKATDRRGLAFFNRSAPEKTYVFGEDPDGGVFISENFYYDSEIYDTKVYAVTDRPLYRPGDTVYVKLMARAFRSARESAPAAAGDVKLQVFDANGFPVAGTTLRMVPGSGGDTSFQLPANAVAGGYEMRMSYGGAMYGAAFRVAEYQKPHFEIEVQPAKKSFRTGEEVKGRVQLAYPDGKPVAGARVELSVRAQRLTMIEGDLGYAGQFPVQLATGTLATDAQGRAEFTLPAAKEPSRYVITVLATDGAAYRVRSAREILVERGAASYVLRAARNFSAPGEQVAFEIRATGGTAVTSPAAWEWVRLEDRRREAGEVRDAKDLALAFPDPGTYTVSLRDAGGNIVAAATHHVSGAGIAAPRGAIEMVFDKPAYRAGDVAHALVTFPQPVEEALLTLERDRVEKTALMARAGGWVRAQRVAPLQWRADIPVRDDYGPNITFSVAYLKGGELVFQNLGLKVEQPRVEVAVHSGKPVYQPGETVTLELDATVRGKAAANAHLAVSVVDEMIYVLQPEIAPDVFEFFYHPRRNNVRTSGTSSFIGYDLARPPSRAAAPTRRETHERALKVLERPRREDKDTALWQPDVVTDATGHARVTFVMPDSLTRWRVTVRAAEPSGVVGQDVAYVRSDKPFYVKWTSPAWMREGDAPAAAVAIFNQGEAEASVELAASGPGLERKQSLNVKPGANFVSLPLHAGAREEETLVRLTLAAGGRTVDALEVPVKTLSARWKSERSLEVALTGREVALTLPADATNVRAQLTDSAAGQFRRVMDDLVDYPYGCVEQTSSRIIPYSLALQSVRGTDPALAARLTQRLHAHRFRLAQMAGPQATFGWWSAPDRDADALLTAYAYYADWYASRALDLELPPGHFDRLADVYRKYGVQRSPWHRALMLHWMQRMGLPVRSLAEALADDLVRAGDARTTTPSRESPLVSVVLAQDTGSEASDMALVLAVQVVRDAQGTVPAALGPRADAAAARLAHSPRALSQALLLFTHRPAAHAATAVLEQVRAEQPTFDRALTLLWTWQALAPDLRAASARFEVDSSWHSLEGATGERIFRWGGTAPPATLRLASAPPAGAVAVLRFESREPETTKLPVRLERRLYRLVRGEGAPVTKVQAAPRRGQALADVGAEGAVYTLEAVEAGAALRTDELYLDEIVLTRDTGPTLRYGIVEVPLAPGMTAERTTWGISVRDAKAAAAEAMPRARFEPTASGYAVPVDALAQPVTIRHLVRAAQPGRFALPPARYYRMYEPEQKAFEGGARAQIEIR
jgi:uncharacterized protein YfaS (alpha-2-macroglobulin family)